MSFDQAVLARAADRDDLLDVITSCIAIGEPFTAEHRVIRAWADARQLTGTNRLGPLFTVLRAQGHIRHVAYETARRSEAHRRPLRVWKRVA